MAQYIDKTALVAEMEKLREELQDKVETSNFIAGEVFIMYYFLSFIDTLEVKEVDLDTDFGVCWGEYCDCGGNINDYEVAKHFFKLGIKATQKGEEV